MDEHDGSPAGRVGPLDLVGDGGGAVDGHWFLLEQVVSAAESARASVPQSLHRSGIDAT
jgi:hypothetical protein